MNPHKLEQQIAKLHTTDFMQRSTWFAHLGLDRNYCSSDQARKWNGNWASLAQQRDATLNVLICLHDQPCPVISLQQSCNCPDNWQLAKVLWPLSPADSWETL